MPTRRKQKKGIPHNPVNITCKFGKRNYKLTTYNYGRGQDKETDRSRVIKVDECKNADIILCQEFTTQIFKKYFSEYDQYVGHQSSNGYTAVLVKKGTCSRKGIGRQIPVNVLDERLQRPYGRHCTVKLDDIIVIAWHGEYKINVPKRKEKFIILQQYAFDLLSKYNLPVIIGGDFNLKAIKDVQSIMNKPPPNCDQRIINPKHTHDRKDIDYFYVVYPKFKFKEAVQAQSNDQLEQPFCITMPRGKPHNPVNSICSFGKKNYRFTTYNYGCGQDEETDRSRIIQKDECENADIIFFQEYSPTILTNIDEYDQYVGYKLGNGYTAVLVKKETCSRKERGRQIPVNVLDELLQGPYGRHCTVKLDDIIVISWQGKDFKTMEQFIILQKYAFELLSKYTSPVIIGGNFNLDAQYVKLNMNRPPPNCYQYIRNPGHLFYDIDFFYVVFPNLQFGAAVAPLPHDKLEEAIGTLGLFS